MSDRPLLNTIAPQIWVFYCQGTQKGHGGPTRPMTGHTNFSPENEIEHLCVFYLPGKLLTCVCLGPLRTAQRDGHLPPEPTVDPHPSGSGIAVVPSPNPRIRHPLVVLHPGLFHCPCFTAPTCQKTSQLKPVLLGTVVFWNIGAQCRLACK